MPRLLTLLIFMLALGRPTATRAYSVLTHQANIDSCWRRCLVPVLSRRYPGATPEEWKEAKAYAYGGAIIQDMGYYPFGSHLFTNLTHYVRSGDFVRQLLTEAQDRNEYAFALGALAHYAADVRGHAEGTNKVVPMMFPKLRQKFGSEVTYGEDPVSHKRIEFAFDVVHLAAGRYRPDAYHDYIGFKVAKPVLERAFLKTYGLELGSVTFNVDLSIGSYRFAVQQLMPLVSRAAWRANRKAIRKENPRARRREYVYRQSPRQYVKEFGTTYHRPKLGASILAGFIRVLPKVGPLKPLKFKMPSPAAQAVFRQSFADVMKEYCGLLAEEKPDQHLRLNNADFDTGHPTRAGEYALADETYGQWLRELASQDFANLSAPMQQNILTFFGTQPKTPADKEEKEADNQAKTQAALARLRTVTPSAGAEPKRETQSGSK